MDSVAHAAKGALVSGGGLTVLQSLLARRIQRPSGLALSVSGFVGTFRLLESLGRKQTRDTGKQSHRHVDSVAAGVAALVAMYFLEAKRKGLLISYAALEALVMLAKDHTSLAEIKYIEVPFAVLACHRIIYTWLYQMHLLTTTQLANLDRLTLVPKDVLARVRTALPLEPYVSRCELFHEGQTCAQFHKSFFQQHVKAAMKLYIPVYFVSAVLTKYDKWIWGPRPSITALVTQYLRTCGCLSLSIVIPVAFSCLAPIHNHRVAVTLAGMVTAIAIRIEHEKRRMSVLKAIAVYPLAAGASQIGLALHLSKRSILLWQYFIFSASMAVLFQRPERQNSKVMRLLFGHKVRSSKPTKETTDTPIAANSPAAQ